MPFGIGDRLHLQAPGRLEIDDRLTGGGTLGDRNRTEHGPDAFRAQILVRRLDVVDVERDVIAADVAVLRLDDLLVRRLVAEQLDVRAKAAADQGDLA